MTERPHEGYGAYRDQGFVDFFDDVVEKHIEEFGLGFKPKRPEHPKHPTPTKPIRPIRQPDPVKKHITRDGKR